MPEQVDGALDAVCRRSGRVSHPGCRADTKNLVGQLFVAGQLAADRVDVDAINSGQRAIALASIRVARPTGPARRPPKASLPEMPIFSRPS
jgi:hypothetical protein